MKKVPHFITPTKKTTMPKHVVFFDTESRVPELPADYREQIANGESVELIHEPYLIVARFMVYNDTPEETTDKEKVYFDECFCERFWHNVYKHAPRKGLLYVFAHNAKYDVLATGGIKHLIDLGFTVDSFSSDNPFLIRLKQYDTKNKPVRTILLLSTTNFFHNSLKNLGKMINLEKLEAAYNNENLGRAVTYCKRDVEILKRITEQYIDFLKKEQLGNFGITVAAQAFISFRYKFLKTDIRVHTFEGATVLEREAYSGGRTEAFFLGEIPETVYYLDVNSMYPYVMKVHDYPVELVAASNTYKIEDLTDLMEEGYLLIARVKLSTDENCYPLREGKLLFPLGEFTATLSTPEIKYAISHNHIVEVEQTNVYIPFPLFTGYVDYFYNRRLEAKKEGNEVYSYLYKLFLNSLYGKFGQTALKFEKHGDCNPDAIGSGHYLNDKTKKLDYFKWFGGTIFKKTDLPSGENESYNSFPAIAAHVTAHARLLLWEGMKTAGKVFYCDTDSIFTNEKGFDNLNAVGLINGKTLGAFKLEKKGTAFIYGLKDYRFTDEEGREEIRLKGLSKNAEKLNDLDFIQTNWIGLDKAIHDGDLDGYHNTLNKKTIRQTLYNKGEVNPDGNIQPFTLSSLNT